MLYMKIKLPAVALAALLFAGLPLASSSAFVAGVKIGSGNWDASFSPAGSLIPQTLSRAQRGRGFFARSLAT